jgi:methionyl-tRNA formyltransferase
MKIGYFADGPWSHRSFEKLIQKKKLSISFVCARFDKNDEVLKRYARTHNIPFLSHKNINDQDFLEKDEVKCCDLFVSMSFNQIFRKATFETPHLGTINCHAGKLPYYRGRNILNWVLINDESEFGITVHYVDEGIDTGDIIKQSTFQITDADDYSTLLEKAYSGCADLLSKTVDDFLEGEITRIAQNDISKHGLYCSARREGDEIINWNSSSREIFNFVRSITTPGPLARSFISGEEVKIKRTEFIEGAPIYKGIPGSILTKEGTSFLIKTKDSYIRLLDWKSSKKLRAGDRFC